MEKTRERNITVELQGIYDRYSWLNSKLAMQYNIHTDNCPTLRGKVAIDRWYFEFKDYLDKRFWREYTGAVERAKKAEAELVEA